MTAECTGDREGLNYCEEFQVRDVPANGTRRNGHAAAQVLGMEGRPRRPDAETPDKRPSAARDKFDKLFNA